MHFFVYWITCQLVKSIILFIYLYLNNSLSDNLVDSTVQQMKFTVYSCFVCKPKFLYYLLV
jgi:hypothetical protein